MALPNVSSGQPHVAAHNNERAVINALQAVTDPDFMQALSDYVAGMLPPETGPVEISHISGLVDALAGKSNTGHTHSAADVGAIPSGDVARIVRLTQAEYDALTPKVTTTLYVIVGA